jgi:hypothetical protein
MGTSPKPIHPAAKRKQHGPRAGLAIGNAQEHSFLRVFGARGPPSGRAFFLLEFGQMDGLDGCLGVFPSRVGNREKTPEYASNPSIRPRRT